MYLSERAKYGTTKSLSVSFISSVGNFIENNITGDVHVLSEASVVMESSESSTQKYLNSQ